jgi:hypothetical protein
MSTLTIQSTIRRSAFYGKEFVDFSYIGPAMADPGQFPETPFFYPYQERTP